MKFPWPLLVLGVFSLLAFPAALRYDLMLAVDASGAFQGEVSVTMPVFPGQTEALFRLYPNHFGPFLHIEEAFWQEQPVALDSVEPTVAVVFLPANPSQTGSLRLKFSGALPSELLGYGIFARTPKAMALSQGYPILAPWEEGWVVHPTFSHGDNLVAEVADYSVTLRIPPGWIPVASGEEVELGSGAWRIQGENLRELGLVLVSGYATMAAEVAGLRLRVFFPPELKFAAAQALAVTQECFALFTACIGTFPYPDLDFVVVPLSGAGGVEYPGLILIGQQYAQDPSSPFFAEIVAHELAHQWWYGEVGTDQVAEPWLDEGLATFTSALYFHQRGELESVVAAWRERYARAQRGNPQASVGSPLWAFPGGLGYSGYVYAGGALFLEEVQRVLGDPVFFEALRAFRENFRWKIAHGCDLLSFFGSQEALRGLVETYFGNSLTCVSGENR